jgi:hypothetical protein
MFTVESVTNLQWDNPEHTSFSCNVKYAEFNEEMPAGINATDTYAHIQEIWARGIAGEYGVIAEYEPPEIPPIPEPAPESEQPITEGTQKL